MAQKYLIAIQGPTASGKTRVAIEIAKWLKTEIVSCDSRQFYKELRIGSAPPTEQELNEVKHHFIQHKSVTEELPAGEYEREALEVIDQIHQVNQFVVLVGGSGLFADAVIQGFDSLPPVEETVRDELQSDFDRNGIGFLQDLLKAKDPEYFEKVDPNNPHRLIRALEVILSTGKKYSELRTEKAQVRPFTTISFALNMDRKKLYERINRRVDLMIQEGLVEEVRSLLPYQNLQPLNTVGYKELFSYFNQEIAYDEAVELIKRNSRRYAKRQLTWLRRNKQTHWVEHTDLARIKQIITETVNPTL